MAFVSCDFTYKAGLLDKHALVCFYVLTAAWMCILPSFGAFGWCWECGEVGVTGSVNKREMKSDKTKQNKTKGMSFCLNQNAFWVGIPYT